MMDLFDDGHFLGQLLRSLLRSLPDRAVSVLDPEGRVVGWSEAAEGLTGFRADEAVGSPFTRFYHSDAASSAQAEGGLRTAVVDGSAEWEAWHERRDAAPFRARATLAAMRDRAAGLTGFVQVVHDLSAERARNERLLAHERQLAEAQRLARLGSWQWEVASDTVTWSDELYRIYGLRPREFGATFAAYLERVHPEDRERVTSLIAAAHRDGTPFEFEERIVRPDGEVRLLRSRGAAEVGEDGTVLRLLGACQDVTEQAAVEQKAREFLREQARRAAAEEAADRLEAQAAELEAQAEELQRLMEELELSSEEIQRTNEELLVEREAADRARAAAEEANRAKSDFLAAMSHELRTPLNAIAGYAELIEIGVHGPLTDAQRAAIRRIQRNQQRLLSLVNDVLNFVRLEGGKVRLDIGDVLVEPVLHGLDGLIEPQVHARGLRYECRECESALMARADPEKVEQILLNLLSNAIRFTPEVGRITLQGAADGARVRISVTDTGPGIPADKLQAIFEPFVQVHHPPSREGEGVGLGLAISRDLARAMGGDLSVESVVGEGSIFTLHLPRVEVRPTFPLPPLASPTPA